MTTAHSFSADYQGARARFREHAKRAGGTLDTLAHPETGPDGCTLSTDIACFGDRDAPARLLLISGTHGVEGFCGSGAQIDLLRRGEMQRLPAGIGVVMVHAINPYGFAWRRRVTHENVDLNRNWIDFAAPLPRNPGYDELAGAIVPRARTPAALSQSAAALDAYGEKHGQIELVRALSGGQYAHPEGIFYGGTAPTWSRRAQESIVSEYLRGAGTVGIIDYHTGLGPEGYGEQINTHPRSSADFRRAHAWYGAALASVADGTSASAMIAGDGLSAAPALLPGAQVTAMALEFGTQPLDDVLEALRSDAWLHAYSDPSGPQAGAIKRQITEAFYVDRDDWRGMVAGQSLLAVRQALAALASAVSPAR